MTPPHLHPNTAKLLLLSAKERQEAIQAPKWIPYAQARRIEQKLDDLLNFPSSLRMPYLFVVGDTNNGKTTILKRYAAAHGPFAREEDGRLIWPVICVQAPPKPDEKLFYDIILDHICVPSRSKDCVAKKEQQVIHLLRHMEVKLLILDAIQPPLVGKQIKQRAFLNMLKGLSNELRISLVGAGVGKALGAIQHDEQMASRFEPVGLPRWVFGEEYLRLLVRFEQLLPLQEASNLSEDALAHKLLRMSDGTIGALSKILNQAATLAIETGTERITLALLDKLA